ncbi:MULTISPECIES: restriction endonuclease subunit S [Streptomyces]|uniref:restriction endonuclease subunit S n=1 Tax=Streptomyces TaxID=1883 RepID=UPI001F2E8965|nr:MULTISPECIES: restriction endonuclease subunit S [Streptomyces]
MLPLGEGFASIRNGMNIKQDKSPRGLPITRIETISKGVVDPNRVGYAGLEREDCRDWILQEGDILFSHINSVEHIAKCAIYRGEPRELVHGMNLLRLRVEQSILDPNYAIHAMRTPEFRARIMPFVNRAVNQASISIGNLKGVSLPAPSLEEQARVVNLLDQVDSLRDQRRKATTLLNDLAHSIFFDMFEEGTRSTKWPRMPISDIGEVVTGSTPETSNASYFDGPIPFATPAEIGKEWLVRTTSRTLTSSGAARGRLIPSGSVLVTCIGASLGNVSLAEVPLATNQQINSVVLNGSIIDSWYALFAFKKLLPDLWNASSSTTLPIVSKRKFQSLQIPVPEISEQRKFGSVMSRLKREMVPHHDQISVLDELFTALQQRAFSGTLWDHEATA